MCANEWTQKSVLLQLTKLRGKSVSAGAKLSVEPEAGTNDDVASLRQQVAELEQSKPDVNAAVNGEATGSFYWQTALDSIVKCSVVFSAFFGRSGQTYLPVKKLKVLMVNVLMVLCLL